MHSKFFTMTGGGAGGGIKLDGIAITTPPDNITYLPGAVSYTHLDVYKRQERNHVPTD